MENSRRVRIARWSFAACCLTLIAACDQFPGNYEESDSQLIVARCALIERMGYWQGFGSGDPAYTILMRCPDVGRRDVELLNAHHDRFGLAKSGMESGVQAITVFYCEEGGSPTVANRIGQLNQLSNQTGFRFALSPATVNCRNHFPRKEDRLTE
ncbi:MAG: hypothetical protein ABMA14_14475 [Hyphomonadaceae bacterium]